MKKIKKNKYMWLAFLVALLPRLITVLWAFPLNVTGDEFFSFMTPAKLAGLDWSGVAANYRYYGYGFLVLFTPLFKWIENPVLLYRIMVAVMAIAQSMVALISYQMIKRFFKIDNEKFMCLSAIACSYFVTIRAVYVYNEHIYILLSWLIAYVLLLLQESIDNKKKKRIYSFILAFIMAYAMTIHSRAITFWIGLVIVVLFYFWTYRKWLISFFSFGIMGVGGLLLSLKGIDRILAFVSQVGGKGVANTAVSFSMASITESPKAWIGWVYVILGQINTMAVITGGMAIFCAMIGCRFVWKGLLRKREIIQGKNQEEGSKYIVIFVLFLVTTAITILGQAFSWLPQIIPVIETGVAADGLRAVTYLRYYGVYFGPILLMGLTYSYQYKTSFENMFKHVFGIIVGLQLFWLICILPYVTNFSGTSWDFAPFSFTKPWMDPIRLRTYLPATVMALTFSVLLYFCYKKKKVNMVVGLLCCLLMYEYGYNVVFHEGARGKANYESIDDIYKVLKPIEKKDMLPREIYVQNTTTKLGHNTQYLYQFMFARYKLKVGYPEDTMEEAVFITGNHVENAKLLKQGYLCAQLDNQEYIYVKGEKLQKEIEEQGVTLLPYLKYKADIGLQKFESENSSPGFNNFVIESNGLEGYLLMGYQNPFTGGKFGIEASLEYVSSEEEFVGVFEVLKEGTNHIIYKQEIRREDFDEDGKLRIEALIDCGPTHALEPRIWISKGSIVRVNQIVYSKTSNEYTMDLERGALKELIEAANDIDPLANFYYLNPYSYNEVDLNIANEFLEKRTINQIHTQKNVVSKETFTLLPNMEDLVFDLVSNYLIIAKNENLVLAVPKNSVLANISKSKGMALSNDLGIEKLYFQSTGNTLIDTNAPIKLRGGNYTITLTIKAKEEQEFENGIFRVLQENSVLGESEIVFEQSKKVQAQVEISSVDMYWALETKLLLPKDIEVSYIEIHIKKNR